MTFRDSCGLLSYKIFSAIFVKKKFSCNISKFHMDSKNEAIKKSKLEIISVPPIVAIYRQALQTFDVRSPNDFTTNFNKLKTMVDTLRAEDLGFDNRLNDPAHWNKPNKAPCTYIEVFQNENVNMSIFVLKPGFKMPLHDHPHMHGLLKVITGVVNVKSFTEYPLKEVVNLVDFKLRAKLEADRLAHGTHKRRKLFAQISCNKECAANEEACILTPTISNYHEIEALKLPAAFFDILSPPYDTLLRDIGPRRCRYYKVANELSTNVVELQETTVSECFYCDQAPYLGPLLA